MKEAFSILLNRNLDKMQDWLDKTAAEDPAKAFDFMLKLSEYIIPKLARTELSTENTEQEGITGIKVEIVLPDNGRGDYTGPVQQVLTAL